MNTQRNIRVALGALTLAITCVAARADEATGGSQLVQPGFDRLIPTSYPLIQPDFAKLKVTTRPSQLIQPSFEELIPTSHPVVRPDRSKFQPITYPVNAAAVPLP